MGAQCCDCDWCDSVLCSSNMLHPGFCDYFDGADWAWIDSGQIGLNKSGGRKQGKYVVMAFSAIPESRRHRIVPTLRSASLAARHCGNVTVCKPSLARPELIQAQGSYIKSNSCQRDTSERHAPSISRICSAIQHMHKLTIGLDNDQHSTQSSGPPTTP